MADTLVFPKGSVASGTRTSSYRCLQDILKDRAESEYPGKFISFPLGNESNPQRICYRTLYRQALSKSAILRSIKGFTETFPILIHLDDALDTITWTWAVLLANAVPVLSTPFSNIHEQRERQIQDLSILLQSPICITRNDFIPLFGEGHGININTIESLQVTGSTQHPLGEDRSLPRWARNCTGNIEQNPAILMLTSGSTGSAKAVCLTHTQLLKAIKSKASVRALPSDGRFLNWIGLEHVASLVEIHFTALFLGVDQIHIHPADMVSKPLRFLDLISQYRVSRTFAPNFFLAKLVLAVQSALPKEKNWDLSGLVALASGGEANDINTCIKVSAILETYGAPRHVLTPGFGMTETCAGAIWNLGCPDYDMKHGYSVASLGKCVEGIELRVMTASPDGNPRPALANEPGDLELRGPLVFNGYFRNPKATREAFTPDGWFQTGDKGVLNTDGIVSLVGRSKDVININGNKFATTSIQESLEQALGTRVSRVICFPSTTSHTEQVTIAYIPHDWPVLASNVVENADIAIKTCILQTGSRPYVFSIGKRSVSLVPISTLGKISGTKMRSLFEAGVFAEDANSHVQTIKAFNRDKAQIEPRPAASGAELKLVEDFAHILGISSEIVDVESSIFELGFTSMDLIRLKQRLDVRLETTVPIFILMKHPTARLLAAALGLEPDPDQGLSTHETIRVMAYDPVITLNPAGSKAPLWLIHPGVGEVLVFVGLAQHLASDDRPIYALRARGFDEGQDTFSSIREATETYVKAIQERQPQGPYAIAGYSYGAMLAFEITKMLNAHNGGGVDTVQFLGSFNLPPHIKSRMRYLNWNLCLLHLSSFLGLVTQEHSDSIEDDGWFRNMSKREALAKILADADMYRMKELGLGEKELWKWASVAYGLQSMAIDYEPEGMVGVIDVFHAEPIRIAATSRQEWIVSHLQKWADFCESQPTFHEVGGGHYTMIGPDHVLKFSIKLKAALRARGL